MLFAGCTLAESNSMTFGTKSWLFIYEVSSEEKCVVGTASAGRGGGSDWKVAIPEWIHGGKERMRKVEEEGVYTVLVVCMIIHD